jgi:NADH-quinone oxidoreductase subunit N
VVRGLEAQAAGATAAVLVLAGFGFKVAAVAFHQWAPDAYEGAPAPVAAWIGSGSKVASFVALAKVLVIGLGAWSSTPGTIAGPGWVGLVGVIAALSMTYGNLAALGQRNLKRLLGYSSIAQAGYLLVGVAALAVSTARESAAGALLYYLITYAAATIGAFALAAWVVVETGSDGVDDLDGLGVRHPFLGVCLTLLMLSLVGLPPLAGFVGKLAMFMQALNSAGREHPALMWLVAVGFLNSVVSAFYYVRILRALFLRPPARPGRRAVPLGIGWGIVAPAAVVVGFGVWPRVLLDPMTEAARRMLTPGMLTAPLEAGPVGESAAPAPHNADLASRRPGP